MNQTVSRVFNKILGPLMGFCLLSSGLGSVALAYAPDGELMQIKGYSPELIQTTNQQRNRQEWKEPSRPLRSPIERFLHNVYYGDWVAPVDDFGGGVIRRD